MPPKDQISVDLCTIRALPHLLDDDDVEDLDLKFHTEFSLKDVIQLLKSSDEMEREEAIATLAEIVDGAFGADGVRLGENLRACGGISLIAGFLADPDEAIQQMSLGIIGNLCSDAVDGNSAATKAALLPHAIAVFSFVYTHDPTTLCLACGALQNLTASSEWSELAVFHKIHLRLEKLVVAHQGDDDGHIMRYASGALRNITSWGEQSTSLSSLTLEAITQRAREHRIESLEQQRARAIVARAVLSIDPERRRKWQELGLLRKQLQLGASDTASDCSGTTWSYELGPSRHSSRSASRDVSCHSSRSASRDVSCHSSRSASRDVSRHSSRSASRDVSRSRHGSRSASRDVSRHSSRPASVSSHGSGVGCVCVP